jgi:hypothetical protein
MFEDVTLKLNGVPANPTAAREEVIAVVLAACAGAGKRRVCGMICFT